MAGVSKRVVLVFIGLQLVLVLSSMDTTIVATALPSISRDLGGFSRVTWVITGYSLSLVASMPLWGKVGDLHGRKRALLAAVTIFLAGSMVCGVAQSMNELLGARFVQGLGAGGIGTIAMAVTADIVPARQLGRWLGYSGMAFAIASVVGPVVGGLFVDHLSWRWAFYINVPFGIVGILLIASQLDVPYPRLPHALDWAGSLLLMGALSSFVVVATIGGTDFPWVSAQAFGLVAAVVVLGVLFIVRERRAAEPVLPLRLFDDTVIRVSTAVNLASGLMFYCGIFFVPLFMQEVHGVSPTSSGLVLTPLMFGAAFGTTISGRRVERSGEIKRWPIIGSAVSAVGVLLLMTLRQHTPVPAAAFYVLVLGIGIGFVMQPSLLAAQNSAGATDLGTVTSTALLFRMMGSTIGVPIFGGILNAGLPASHRTAASFAHALPPVFAAALPVALAAIVVALFLPERPLRETTHIAEALL